MPETESTFPEQLERIEALIQQIQAAGDPAVRSSAEELVEVLLDLHRAGIERVLDIVWEEGEVGRRIIHERLPENELVNSLLILHGLHPLSLETRVLGALETVRPYMHSHGGDVELVGIEDGVVHLRLAGSCEGCRASAVTLQYAVEDAIYEAAPEVMGVEAVGALEEDGSFIPLEILKNGETSAPREQADGRWIELSGLGVLEEGVVRAEAVAGQNALFCRVGEELYAYANTCAGCHQPLDGASLDGAALTCPHCEETFDVVKAGRGTSEEQLEPIPLLREDGRVRIALPEAF